MAWGNKDNLTERLRHPSRLMGQELAWGEEKNSTLRSGFSGELFPSALFTVQPGFKHHPAAVSWITSVALAAAKTEAATGFIVRLMREDEYNALLKYVYGDMPEEDIRTMSVLGKRREPVSVVGSEADTRTCRGITDAFGHMWNWLDDLYDPTALKKDDAGFAHLSRVQRGVSCLFFSETGCMAERGNFSPDVIKNDFGVRFVAVPTFRFSRPPQ